MSTRLMAAILFTSYLSIGCSSARLHRETPDISRYKFPTLPEYTIKGAVTAINTQPSTDPYVIYSTASGMFGVSANYIANLHEWTDAAIELTNRQLAPRLDSTSGPPKSLKLSITEIKMTVNGWAVIGNIEIRAITGKGVVRMFHGEKYGAVTYIVSAALNEAVAAMLKDRDIIAYLTDQDQ